MAEDRDEVPVHAGAAERVVLGVVVGHSGCGHRRCDADALEVCVDGDRKPELVRRLPERVVHRIPVRDPRRAREEDPRELVAPADAADLASRCLRPLRRHDDHPAQARLLLQPPFEQPVVVSAAEARSELRVREDRERRAFVRLDNPGRDVVGVEVPLT